MSSTPTATATPRGAIGVGRSGPIRAALVRALQDARDSGRMTPEHELTGALAGKVAALVDRTAAAGDGAAMLRAIRDLRDLLDTLPIREVRPAGARGGDHDGAADDGPAELRLLSDPPTLGDTADP